MSPPTRPRWELPHFQGPRDAHVRLCGAVPFPVLTACPGLVLVVPTYLLRTRCLPEPGRPGVLVPSSTVTKWADRAAQMEMACPTVREDGCPDSGCGPCEWLLRPGRGLSRACLPASGMSPAVSAVPWRRHHASVSPHCHAASSPGACFYLCPSVFCFSSWIKASPDSGITWS